MNLFGGGFGAAPQPAALNFGAAPAAAGFGASPAAGAAPAIGGSMGMAGAGPQNRWVPDAGEERYVTSTGSRGSISSLAWFANGFLALTTWDANGEVQVLDVQQQGHQVQAKLNTAATMAAPVLCSVCQGTSVAVGTADNKLRVWNVQGGPTAVSDWGAHQAPVTSVMLLESAAGWPVQGYLTGALDKNVCLWTSQGSPASATLPLDCKVSCSAPMRI
jgi:WD40 repeat protein